MPGDTTTQALIDDIYATALGDQPWEPVLHGIRRLADVRLVSLMTLDGAGVPMSHNVASDDQGWAEELRHSYNSEFYRYDYSTRIVANWAAGQWFDDRQWSPPEERARSIFHQEFMRPRDADYWEGTFFHRTDALSYFLSLTAGGGAQDKGRSSRDLILGLQAHLNRAVRMQARFDALEGHAAHGDATLDALAAPVFLLDEQRRLVRANSAAQALMAREAALCFVQGRFAPAGYSEPASWKTACQRGVIAIARKEAGARPLILSLIPVPARTHVARAWQRPLMLMMAPGVRSALALQRHLCAIYGLTATEAEVCVLLCEQGLSPQACADARQVSLGTIRSQIKAIHIKTGVMRLPELVRLVASL